jgi:hypothetical protein
LTKSDAFSLEWWRSKKSEFDNFGEEFFSIGVTNFSPTEEQLIKGWIANNALSKNHEYKRFTEYLDPLFSEKFGLSESSNMYVHFQTLNIFGTSYQLESLDRFLWNIRVTTNRIYETVVNGLEYNDICDICDGHNYRIIDDEIDRLQHGVSVDDKNLLTELILRSNYIYNSV